MPSVVIQFLERGDFNQLTNTNMNTQLKKGDKCNSPWGVVTVNDLTDGSDIIYVTVSKGIRRSIHRDELTRIPTHAERMQAILDIAWDVENRLQDDETVQLKVGAFAEFARHYYEMQEKLEYALENAKKRMLDAELTIDAIRKLLKGE